MNNPHIGGLLTTDEDADAGVMDHELALPTTRSGAGMQVGSGPSTSARPGSHAQITADSSTISATVARIRHIARADYVDYVN